MMMRRGLTMIEMLLAVALLSAVVAAAASWIAIAGRLGTYVGGPVEPQRQRHAVEAVFALIADDLVTGDFDPARRSSNKPPRVRMGEASVLEIDTRAGTTCIYRLDHSARRLDRIVRSASSNSAARPLLENVSEFTCALDDEKRTLDVTLAITGATQDAPEESRRRRYRLP